MPRKKSTNTDLTNQSVALAEIAAKALVAAEHLGIKKKVVDGFTLDEAERALAADLPGLTATLKKKLTKMDGKFTVAETASILMALAESLREGEPLQQFKRLVLAKRLMDCLQANVLSSVPAEVKNSTPTGSIYQFKITLLGIEPAIWRRIQVQDCTLDELHAHIQTAMGWTNSHLHQFDINGKRYGDPELLDDGFADFECVDSTIKLLSEIVPQSKKRFAFTYEYDFGDGWEHEVLYEGSPPLEKGKKSPLCLEGGRACPPEDCGGVWGYADFLDAINDDQHEQHEDMLEWIGGSFDPEEFDAKKATREMKKGLPDWRNMR